MDISVNLWGGVGGEGLSELWEVCLSAEWCLHCPCDAPSDEQEGVFKIDVHSFALATVPLQVFREETLVEELIMDMEFSWNGDQKFQLMVSLLPACWYL